MLPRRRKLEAELLFRNAQSWEPGRCVGFQRSGTARLAPGELFRSYAVGAVRTKSRLSGAIGTSVAIVTSGELGGRALQLGMICGATGDMNMRSSDGLTGASTRSRKS
jgi:hypothetical protein